jgi:hypothetical protein
MCICIAGALVLCCFLIAALVLPRLKQQIADMQEKKPGMVTSLFSSVSLAGNKPRYGHCCC